MRGLGENSLFNQNIFISTNLTTKCGGCSLCVSKEAGDKKNLHLTNERNSSRGSRHTSKYQGKHNKNSRTMT